MSAACRAAGVSRPTGHKWLRRAAESGLGELREQSRRPKHSPGATGQAQRQELLVLKGKYPGFGAKKLVALMDCALPARTANRILASEGLRCGPSASKEQAFESFERPSPNELWQMDFKGLPRRCPYQALSVIDDHSRFSVDLAAIADQTLNSLWEVLWKTFEHYGLPEAILTDNGPSFRNNGTWRPSAFDARLMKLGIRPVHTRPYRPQTQGKVERFHGTLQRDLGQKLAKASLEQAALMLSQYRDFYNWERPHEALGQRMPGAVYRRSQRARPEKLPTHQPKEGAIRRTDEQGFFSYKGQTYKAGRGLAKEQIAICERQDSIVVVFANFQLGTLEDYAH